MYDLILLPTDGHAEMAPVTEQALELARRFDATVHTLYVRTAGDDGGENAVETVVDRGRDLDVTVETVVRQGDPAETIREYAHEAGVDLIVMGTHGRTGLDRVLTGSVAESVVRTVDLPVLTVHVGDGGLYVGTPENARTLARERLESLGYENVAVESSPSRQRTTWVVETEADGHGVRVHVNGATGHARVVDTEAVR